MSRMTCHLCGLAIAPTGPCVEADRSDSCWRFIWVPFIEDRKSIPQRLMHKMCFVEKFGVEDLIVAVELNDQHVRRGLSR